MVPSFTNLGHTGSDLGVHDLQAQVKLVIFPANSPFSSGFKTSVVPGPWGEF
jgi:hypothetical protein